MTVLIPSDKGFECGDCDFITDDVFLFLDHCDVSFSWGIRLSNRYTLDLFAVLEAINQQLKNGHTECAVDLLQSITLSLVNASEGEQSFHKFVNEVKTVELATDLMQGIEEMLKKDEKPNDTKE
jgi:hypothetical protein